MPETEDNAIREIHFFIVNNYIQGFKIKDLLAKYPISSSTLRRGFKLIYGESIDRFRLRLSMQTARKMLESGHQVKEVSLELGYKTAGSFARAFKKIFGVTPMYYSRGFLKSD